MSTQVHCSKAGTYHPVPARCPAGWTSTDECATTRERSVAGTSEPIPECPVCSHHVAWTIHDSRGTLDGGQACDECGACDCDTCQNCQHVGCDCTCERHEGDESAYECVGLSFSFVCLDGGDVLCEECAERAGIEVVECDCK